MGVVSDGQTLHMNATEAGDEAFMLAKHLPGVPVLIGPERYMTGSYAIEHFGAEVAILDDGYQHWMLERDMEILLVDAVNVFGNGYILPRGTLRDPVSHIDRADVCLLTKVDQATESSRQHIHSIIHEENNHALVVESVHQPKGFIRFEEWANNITSPGVDVAEMRGKRVMAVSAIGNPASFEQTLSDVGAVVIESLRFPDHHDYTVKEMLDVAAQAVLLEAEAIVITEKDAVKVPAEIVREREDFQIPIYVVSVEVTFRDGEEEFIHLMKESLNKYMEKKGRNEKRA